MDDHPEVREMILAGAFYTVMIGLAVWQILRLLGSGGLDAVGIVRLGVSLFILGIMFYIGSTMLTLWT
jgi:hypothetical protein